MLGTHCRHPFLPLLPTPLLELSIPALEFLLVGTSEMCQHSYLPLSSAYYSYWYLSVSLPAHSTLRPPQCLPSLSPSLSLGGDLFSCHKAPL